MSEVYAGHIDSMVKAATPYEPSQIQQAMNELQAQISRCEEQNTLLMEKCSALMRPMPSASNGNNDIPAGSPLAMEIWRKADDLRVANNTLYQIINAIDL